MTFTRRTHIVRCSDAKKGEPPSETKYVDVEVLDAVAFKTENGKEMVLNFKKENVVPYIVDDTDGGNGKSPNNATRRSHMKRITDEKTGNTLDVEVLDCCAFIDQNGEEWILNLPVAKSSVYDTTAGSGDAKSTRRTHDEKKTVALKDDDSDTSTNYLTVRRTDMVTFRTINGKEMTIKMPSGDEGQKGSKIDRSNTHTTPDGYDPTDNSPDAVKPPANDDPNIYVAFSKKDSSVFTGDEKIDQGMLWWIRKIKGGKVLMLVTMHVSNYNPNPSTTAPNEASTNFSFLNKNVKLLDTGKKDVNKYVGPGIWYVYLSPPTHMQIWLPIGGTQGGGDASVTFVPFSEGPLIGYAGEADFLQAKNTFYPFGTTDIPPAQWFTVGGTIAQDHTGVFLTDPNLYQFGTDNTPSYFDSRLGGFHYYPGFFPGMTPEQEALNYQNNGLPTLYDLGDHELVAVGWPAGYESRPNSWKAYHQLGAAETRTTQSFLFEVDAGSDDPCLTMDFSGWPTFSGSGASVQVTVCSKPMKTKSGGEVKTVDDWQNNQPDDSPDADDTFIMAGGFDSGQPSPPATLTIGVKPDPNSPPSYQYWRIFSPAETKPFNTDASQIYFHANTGRSPDDGVDFSQPQGPVG